MTFEEACMLYPEHAIIIVRDRVHRFPDSPAGLEVFLRVPRARYDPGRYANNPALEPSFKHGEVMEVSPADPAEGVPPAS